MKQHWLHFVLAGFALLGLESCGSGSQAGGPASETTNGIMASVLAEDGYPAYAAVAALRKADFVSSDTSGVVSSVDFTADSLGNLRIPKVEPGTYRLTVSQNGGSSIYSQEILVSNESIDLGQIQLQQPGTISGKFSDENGLVKAQWIGVYGLDILTHTDSNGNFSIHGLPSGIVNLYALEGLLLPVIADTSLTVKSNETNAWIHTIAQRDTTSKDTTAKDTAVWMLFEDFDDSTAFAAKAWYYTATADTSVDISYSIGDAWNFVKWNADRNGKVFSGSSPVQTCGYVLLGTQISPTGIDLSTLDSVSFYAKGSGYIRFALEHWVKSGAPENLKAWTSNIPLTSNWKRYTITPADFIASTSNSTGWDNVKKTVSQVHIFGLGGQEMSLDDITFYGVKF